MSDGSKHLVKVPLREVVNRIQKVNRELGKLISTLSENHTYDVIIAKYAYSDHIIDRGKLSVPCHDSSCQNCNELIKRYLSYSPIPLCIALENSVEVTEEISSDKKIPIRILNKGEAFGFFEIMDYLTRLPIEANWSVSAGSRSIFLAGMALGSLQRKLKNQGVTGLTSARTYNTLSDLLRDASESGNWKGEVIILTEDLLKGTTPHHDAIRKYIGEQAWRQSRFLREDRILYDHLTELYEKHQAIKAERYAKIHLLILTTQWGETPAYCAIDANEDIIKGSDIAPIQTISDMNSNEFKILVPFHLRKDRRGICSLSAPNIFNITKERSHSSDLNIFMNSFHLVNDDANRNPSRNHLFIGGNPKFYADNEAKDIMRNDVLHFTDIGFTQAEELTLPSRPIPLQAYASIIGAQRFSS